MDIISIQKFSEFIIKALPKVSQPNTIASFAFSPENSLPVKELNFLTNEFEKSFYWEKPSERFFIAALGDLLSITEPGIGRFALIEKKIRQLKANFINNWNDFGQVSFPLFVGAMKFSSEGEKGLWENYYDSNWFIPHILITGKDLEIKIIYNFLISPKASQEKLISDFNYRISQLSKMAKKTSEQTNTLPPVSSISGNSQKDKKKWMEAVKKAINEIEFDKVKKVVLSRKVEIELKWEPDISHIIEHLHQKYPECYLFLFHSGKSSFFGASPEKLIKLSSGWIEADALAGSAPRGNDETEDLKYAKDLQNSIKDLIEHAAVKDYIIKQFSSLADEVYYEESPKIKKLNNIQHLWTPVKAKLKSVQKMFPILENLHPTPAVCGIPKTEALDTIKKLEDYPRGLYSGIIGWFNFDAEAEFSVAIRSALLKGKKLFIFAGGGIVDGSNPAIEFQETELKLKPIFSLFENANKK
ncbi:MAG: isochorismate synthase [Bacteroidota bacterium]|nr:isochorismate synthase [Bacteroidota bacterium]MDP4192084.1 isochorismate synthase [Bacteroidota bacterium]MDP4194775.1 isochorismate synthase [Bacteroidota bacterium]